MRTTISEHEDLMVKVGIIGATGYTGVELLRLLLRHSDVTVQVVTSRTEVGRRLDALFPTLRGHTELVFTDPDSTELMGCDLVFFATPHNVAMRSVPRLLEAGVRVIDLSADYRLQDSKVWSQWYGEDHVSPDLCAGAVYGLPEVNRAAIADASLVACPGCYPTAVQLGFLPLLKAGAVELQSLIASCASGVSGAGRQGKIPSLLTEASESFRAYGVMGHRHLPEIEQGLTQMADTPVQLTFVPHLAPMNRGILATLFAQLKEDAGDCQALFESTYANEPFVDVLPEGEQPDTRYVRGNNRCQLSVTVPQGRRTVVVTAAIDNLTKGASGQAVQAMNIMLGLPELRGLELISVTP
jgi:N-acetyl-gamma-glutamyl-phosphate reductase